MAAHLHRYKSELHRVESILSELRSSKFDTLDATGEDISRTVEHQDNLKIEQLISQLASIISFSNELERKVQNILTLVRLLKFVLLNTGLIRVLYTNFNLPRHSSSTKSK